MTYSYEILINNFMYDPCFVLFFFAKYRKKEMRCWSDHMTQVADLNLKHRYNIFPRITK